MPNYGSSCPFYYLKPKLIKALIVIAERCVSKTGDLELAAPPGLNVNMATGEFTVPVKVMPTDEPIIRTKVMKDKLITEGLLPVRLTIGKDPHCSDQPAKHTDLLIPFNFVEEVCGICPGDHVQEKVCIQALSVFGVPVKLDANTCGENIKIIIEANLNIDILIAREEVIKCYCEVDKPIEEEPKPRQAAPSPQGTQYGNSSYPNRSRRFGW